MNLTQPSPIFVRRWLDAFAGLPDRIKLPLAVALALLLHLLVFALLWAWPLFVQLLVRWSLLPPDVAKTYVAKPTPEPKKLEVTLMTPTPAPKPAPTPTPAALPAQEEKLLKDLFAQLPPERQVQYVDVEGLARKKNMSKQALLESWRDSVAGSRKRGTGNDPLPTLDGLENVGFTQLADKELSLGKPDNPAEEEMRASKAPVPMAKIIQNDLPPLFKPKPADPSKATPDKTPETAEPAPQAIVQATPTPPPTPTPEPKRILVAKATPPPNVLRVPEANAEQIPVFLNRQAEPNLPTDLARQRPTPPEPDQKPTPQPTATPPPKPTPASAIRPTPSPGPAPAPRPKAPPRTTPAPQTMVAKFDPRGAQPRPVANPGYSPQMRRTKLNGASLPQGEDGLDAVATPLGRYKKAVNSAVGSRWNYEIQSHMDLLQIGTVEVLLRIDAKGRLRGFRVAENTSNATHAALVEQCVRKAEFDPPPPEALHDGVFEFPMSFTLY